MAKSKIKPAVSRGKFQGLFLTYGSAALLVALLFSAKMNAFAKPRGDSDLFFSRSVPQREREVLYRQDYKRIAVPLTGPRTNGVLSPFLNRHGLRIVTVQEISSQNVSVVTLGPSSRLKTSLDSALQFFQKMSEELQLPWIGPVFFRGRATTVPTGRLWIYFPEATSMKMMEKTLQRMGLGLHEKLPSASGALAAAVCKKPCGEIIEKAHALASLHGIKVVPELMREYFPVMKPSDTYYELQWYLNNTGNNVTSPFSGEFIPSTPLADIGAEAAWDQTTGDTSVIIGIIDSGIDCTHHEFAGKCLEGLNAIKNEPGGEPPDPTIDMSAGHGTSVASVAAAAIDEEGVVGVCPECMVVPILLLKRATFLTDAMKLRAFVHAVEQGAAIINNSWGPAGEGFYVPPSNGELEGMEYALIHGRGGLGTLVVYAAGNSNQSTSYLGHLQTAFPNVIAVSAVNQFDMRSEYSNFGSHVTLCAPSNSTYLSPSIYAAEITGNGNINGNYTSFFGGTSSAAPVVSGVAGLVLAVAPELDAAELIEVLIATADKIDPDGGRWDEFGHSIKYGYGRVNAARAVLYAQGLDDRPWCDNPAAVDDCDTHFDENCDGYINEGCFISPSMGTLCTEPESCGTENYWECPAAGKQRGLCTYNCMERPCSPGSVCVDGKCSPECAETSECPNDFVCSKDELGVCLPSCSSDEDCADDEFCDMDKEICRMATDGKVGSRCSEPEDCVDGGFCLSEMMGFPEGYCTRSCVNDDNCDDTDRCVLITSHGSFCYKGCIMDGDCRENYLCQQSGPRAGTCYKHCERDDHCTGGDPGWEGIVCDISSGRCIDEREPDAGVPDASFPEAGAHDGGGFGDGSVQDGGVDESDRSSGCSCKIQSRPKKTNLPLLPILLIIGFFYKQRRAGTRK